MISKISIVWLNDHSPTDSYTKSIDAITYHIFKCKRYLSGIGHFIVSETKTIDSALKWNLAGVGFLQ